MADWVNGKDKSRTLVYVDELQAPEAITGKPNPENTNPAFAGRDLVSSLGAINAVEPSAVPATSPISNNIILAQCRPGRRWIDAGLMRYIDKEKSRQLLVSSGLQLPGVLQSRSLEANGLERKIYVRNDLGKHGMAACAACLGGYCLGYCATGYRIMKTPMTWPQGETSAAASLTRDDSGAGFDDSIDRHAGMGNRVGAQSLGATQASPQQKC